MKEYNWAEIPPNIKDIPTCILIVVLKGAVCLIILLSIWLNMKDIESFFQGLAHPVFQLLMLITTFLTLLIFNIRMLKKYYTYISISRLDIFVSAYLFLAILHQITIQKNFHYSAELWNYFCYFGVYISIRFFCHIFHAIQIIYVILANGIILVVTALMQLFGFVELISPIYVVTGTFSNPAPLAGYLLLLIPISVFMISRSKFPNRNPLQILQALSMVVIIVLSKSRAAIFSLTTVVLYLILIAITEKMSVAKKWAISLLSVIMVFLLTFWMYNLRPESADGRILIWKILCPMVSKSPMLGNGLGAVHNEYSLYQAKYFSSEKATNYEKYLTGEVHVSYNEFLTILIESGLVGLVLFFGMIFNVFLISKNAFHEDRLFFYLSLSLMSILLYGLFSYPFQIPAISTLFFIVMGFFGSKSRQFQITYKVARLIPVLFSILTIYLIYSAILNISFIKNWREAQAIMTYNPGEGLATYKNLNRYRLNNLEFKYNYAAELAELGYYDEAILLFEEVKTKRHSIQLYSQLGDCYERIGRFIPAESNYDVASKMQPNLLNPNVLLFRLYILKGDNVKATLKAKEIMTLPVKIKTNQSKLIKQEMLIYLNNMNKALYEK